MNIRANQMFNDTEVRPSRLAPAGGVRRQGDSLVITDDPAVITEGLPGAALFFWGKMGPTTHGRHCHSTLSLTAIDCHSLGIYTVILLPLLSVSIKMTVPSRG
jgi:hypothetical protein